MKLQRRLLALLLTLLLTATSATMAFAQETGGTAEQQSTAAVHSSGTTYASLAEAVDAAAVGDVITLWGDLTESVTLTKGITLDLNGHSIEGTVTVATGCTLLVKDSSTDDFTVADGYGKVNTRGSVRAAEGYIAIDEADGTSYHRLDLELSSVSLRPRVAGVYYTGNFGGDELVKEQIAYYGTALSIYEVPTAESIANDTYNGSHTAFDGSSWICGQIGKANGTLLSGVMKEENSAADNAQNATKEINSVSYVQLKDGRMLLGTPASITLQKMVETIDCFYSDLSQTQGADLDTMYQTYKDAMDGWTIPNLAAGATATKLSASQVSASAGDTVTVEVSVRNNPGILGMLISAEYDESVLTLTGTENGSATAALTYQAPSRLVSGANYLWYGTQTGAVVDGTVLILTFEVQQDAAAGTYPIRLTCSSQDTYDGSYNPIEAVVSNGAVTVAGAPAVVTYTVTFKDHDGTVLKTQTVEEGKSATAPTDPVRDGYAFIGWDKSFESITGNLVVTALYEEEVTGPKFYASREDASAGDTVTVTVSVKNNPGILGMLLTVSYDESVLTLTGTLGGSATAALTYQEPSRLVSGANYLWYGTKTGTVTDGAVLVLTFRVAEGAAPGSYPIRLTCSSQDTYDGNYNPIIATVAEGTVTVR